MDESRFRTANVHHIYTRLTDGQVNGHICLCGEVMLTHRACTEHIVDEYRADLRAQMVALRDELKAKAYAVRDNEGWGNIMLMTDGVQRALDLFDGGTQ